MTTINVIDLDKTLLPYDSFREFVMIQIKKMNFSVFLITLARMMRISSQKEFKRSMIKWSEKHCSKKFLQNFSNRLYKDLDQRVLEIIDEETTSNTINVLVSASPDLYVQLLIDKLKWKGQGSYINQEGRTIHLYGENKISWVKNNYPENEYYYNMSISDSSSDDALLKLFKKEIKWTLP